MRAAAATSESGISVMSRQATGLFPATRTDGTVDGS